ncbi:MAG: hypothetical protein AAF616_13350 [Bacteroidota bacterium]
MAHLKTSLDSKAMVVVRYLYGLSVLFLAFSCQREKSRSSISRSSNFSYALKYLSESLEDQPEFYHFTLEIAPNGDEDLIDFLAVKYEKAAIIDYLSFRLQNEIFLRHGLDTLPVASFHFERSFDLRKSRVFNLAFEYVGLPLTRDDALIIKSKLFDNPVTIVFDDLL